VPYFSARNGEVDFSLPNEAANFIAQLEQVAHNRGYDAYYLASLHNATQGMPYLGDNFTRQHPNEYTRKYIEVLSKVGPNVTIISEYGFKTQHLTKCD